MRRSAQIAKRVRTTQVAKTRRPLTKIIQPGSVARVDLASAWSVDSLPTNVGRSTKEIISAVNSGEVTALVVGGVDPLDLDNSNETLSALKKISNCTCFKCTAFSGATWNPCKLCSRLCNK